jgi:Tol biopolymer transport system component
MPQQLAGAGIWLAAVADRGEQLAMLHSEAVIVSSLPPTCRQRGLPRTRSDGIRRPEREREPPVPCDRMGTMTRAGIALCFLLTVPAAFAANDLTGIIVDTNAKPLPGSTVYVYTAFPKVGVSAFCPSCYRDCGKHASVNRAGRFRLKALDRTLRFDLLAVADGYEPAFVRQIDPMDGPVTIKLARRSIDDVDRLIVGTVVDPHGKPVVGAAVAPNGYRAGGRVFYGTTPGVDRLSFTNAKGEFALRIPVADAKLDVLVTARSLAPHIERMLAPGQRRSIRLVEGATITGHVMKGNEPRAGARVGFVQTNRASSDFLGHFEIGTNENGLFVMTNMGPNLTYTVYTPMEGATSGVAVPKVVTVGDDKTNTDAGVFVVGPGRRIAGKIVVPESSSIPPHTQITLLAAQGSDARSVEVAGDGNFSFDGVPKGGTELTMRIPGLKLSASPAGAQSVVLPTEGDVTDVRVVFERPAANSPATSSASARIAQVTANGKVIQVAISPDGKSMAYVTSDEGQQTLVLRDIVSGQTRTLLPARPTSYWGMTFTSDSSSIDFGARDKQLPAGAIYQISTSGGQVRKIVEGIDSSPTFSPDGKQMAFLRASFPTSDESAVLIANSDGTGVRTLKSVHAPEVFAPIFFAGPSWSPDGTMIAASVITVDKQPNRSTNPKARIVTIDVATGAMKTVVDHGFAIVSQVAWMPDQQGIVAIALSSSARNAQVWYVPYPTGEPQLITRDVLDYRIVSLSADGKSLLTVASQVIADLLSRDAMLITGFRPSN